jgi:hypothetical protein
VPEDPSQLKAQRRTASYTTPRDATSIDLHAPSLSSLLHRALTHVAVAESAALSLIPLSADTQKGSQM